MGGQTRSNLFMLSLNCLHLKFELLEHLCDYNDAYVAWYVCVCVCVRIDRETESLQFAVGGPKT